MSHISIHEGIARHFLPKAPKPTNTTSWWTRQDDESDAAFAERFARELAEKNKTWRGERCLEQ